jgi:hypothetical protein
MSKTIYVFQASSLYREFRERRMKFGVNLTHVTQDGVSIHKVDFISNHFGCLLPEDQKVIDNIQFPYIIFLPEGNGQFDEVLIILNGLNESEYRKFFPWAASLAASGIPTIVFPIAFLINRRPRTWFVPDEVEKKLVRRRNMVGNSTSTPYNVVLSERLEEHPERFFLAGLETHDDLIDLVDSLHNGHYSVWREDKAFSPFTKGTRAHFLGYSLGGYLSLILFMGMGNNSILSQSKLIIFSSGAAINYDDPDLNANPISPIILDRNASERLIGFYKRGESFPFMEKEEALLFKAVFLSDRSIIDSKLEGLKERIVIIGSENDRVIPIKGMEKNLGWIDERLKLGIHEYPFNVQSLEQPNLEREMSRSYDVAKEYQEGFKRFIDCVISAIRTNQR